MAFGIDSPQDLHFSIHAEMRLQQRGIRCADVAAALRFGRRRRTHGDAIWTLDDHRMAGTILEPQAERLRGLEVVVTADGCIRTVKWNRRIAHRPGILRRARRESGT